MSSYITVFPGTTLPPSVLPYTSITLSSNVTLAWTTDFGVSSAYVASWMDVNATSNGNSLIMPNAMNNSVGFEFKINNTGSHSFSLVASDGVTPIFSIAANSLYDIVLFNNTSPNGNWHVTAFGGAPAVSSVAISTSGTSGNLVTSGSPITSSGTITIALGADLAGIAGLGNNIGLAVRTATTGTWSTATITGTANQIVLANGNGIGGNPTITLAPAISGINSIALTAGNISIGVTPNVITSTNVNGNLILQTNGTGTIDFEPAGLPTVFVNSGGLGIVSSLFLDLGDIITGNSISINANNVITSYKVTLPGSLPTTSQVLAAATVSGTNVTLGWTTAATFPGTSTPNTIPIFINSSGTIGDSNVTITGGDVVSNVGIINIGAIQINSAGNSIVATSGNLNLNSGSGTFINLTNTTALLNQTSLLFCNGLSQTSFIALQAPASISSNVTYQLPQVPASNGQVLVSTIAGVMSWTSTLSGLTSVTVGNLTLTGSTLESSSGNSLILATNGSTTALTLSTSQNATFAANVTVTGLVNYAGGTSGTATAGAATLPANPVGFINVEVGGTAFKVPYYNV
jgi:fibronectin-binding autotransporter adhesin